MAYQYDIFVSYRRDPEALLWIGRFLKPIIEHRVSMELQREVKVFVHEVGSQIPAGTAWPVALGEALATSRILIALWSGNYLTSEWCRQELSLMLDREAKTKARTGNNKYGLVVPIVAHDGETIPRPLANAQRLEVKDCFNSRMPSDGPLAASLVDRIAVHASGISGAIKAAPRWQAAWPKKAAKRLLDAFERKQASQRKLPRFGRS